MPESLSDGSRTRLDYRRGHAFCVRKRLDHRRWLPRNLARWSLQLSRSPASRCQGSCAVLKRRAECTACAPDARVAHVITPHTGLLASPVRRTRSSPASCRFCPRLARPCTSAAGPTSRSTSRPRPRAPPPHRTGRRGPRPRTTLWWAPPPTRRRRTRTRGPPRRTPTTCRKAREAPSSALREALEAGSAGICAGAHVLFCGRRRVAPLADVATGSRGDTDCVRASVFKLAREPCVVLPAACAQAFFSSTTPLGRRS